MALPLLGTMIQGGLGLMGMAKGHKQMGNIANNMPSQSDLQSPFQQSQGLIDRMTNFGQYSGQAMDLASMQGNKGVEDAMMMGMGGSQANAIKNRMKRSSLAGVYDKYNQGMSNMVGHQGRIDQTVSSQMHQNAQDANQIRMGQAGAMMGIGQNIMGGAEGMGKFGAGLGSLGKTVLTGGPKGGGGLLGMLGIG